jgi:hypothetical protein
LTKLQLFINDKSGHVKKFKVLGSV